MKSAEQVLLESLDQLLIQQDSDLYVPYSAVNKAVVDMVGHHEKVVTKMVDKILRTVDREHTGAANQLDSVTTTVLGGLDNWLFDQEYLLGQLAAKGNFLKTGEPLSAALVAETTQAGQLAYQGTLVLAVKEAIPWFERIACALEEIARRMPPTPEEGLREAAGEEEGYSIHGYVDPALLGDDVSFEG